MPAVAKFSERPYESAPHLWLGLELTRDILNAQKREQRTDIFLRKPLQMLAAESRAIPSYDTRVIGLSRLLHFSPPLSN